MIKLKEKTITDCYGPDSYIEVLTPEPQNITILGVKVFRKVKVKSLSHVRLFATPWTVAYQAPLSTGFSRQEYCSGLPFSSPEDLPSPGIEPGSPTLQADTLLSEPPGKSSKVFREVIKL